MDRCYVYYFVNLEDIYLSTICGARKSNWFETWIET